ncbi:MAG TPA: PorT family protein [Bacteroidetes bacterium]|nr:PorT family protein [Bacteroidota bacterium]
MRNYLALFVFLIPFSLRAQLEIGFRVGVNMSEINVDKIVANPLDFSDHKGIQLSGIFNFQLSKSLALQPELAFVQKGFKYAMEGGDYQEFLSNYFELPVLGELGVPLGNKLQIFVDAGPSLSYLLSAKESIFNADLNELSTSDIDFDLRKEFERLDYGLNFGGGFSLRFGRSRLRFDARYNVGLNEILTIDTTQAAYKLAKNKVTNFSIGYTYILLGKIKKKKDD